MAKIVAEMEKIRNAVKVVPPKSTREPNGHFTPQSFKLRIKDSKEDVENNRDSVRIQTPVVEDDRVSVRIQTPVTVCAEMNTMADLHTKAIEINSADEVRQAIKAALATKPMTENQNVATDMTEIVPSLPEENLPKKIPVREEVPFKKEVPVAEIQEYKPERGDQVHVPQKSRKRQGNPTKAGPSKRPRTKVEIIDDFYVGKLCNLVPFTKKFSPNNFDSSKQPFMHKNNNGHIWKRFFAN